MDLDTFQMVLFFVCLLLSGFYSGAEAALISLGQDRVAQLVEEGGTKARALEFLMNKPTAVLTTILVGNNLVNILAASLVTVLSQRYFGSDAIAIATGATTFMILIFGEIIPKTFARSKAEELSVVIIRILQVNYYLLFPLVELITFVIYSLLGRDVDLLGRVVTKKDIEFMVNKASNEQSIDSRSLDMISSILEFPNINVKDIMVSRREVKCIDDGDDFRKIITTIREYPHSRFPVIGDDLDDALGFLHVKDLSFVRQNEIETFDVKDYLKPTFFVYEHMKISAVFDHMNRKKVHLALVKDENGLVVGIVTLEDIMEEIFGEIHDEHDLDEEMPPEEKLKTEDGIVVEGGESIRDLYNEYDLNLPLNEDYATLAGFLLDMLGNEFPEEGQLIIYENIAFTIIKVTEQEIKDVRIKLRHDEQEKRSKSNSNGDGLVPSPES